MGQAVAANKTGSNRTIARERISKGKYQRYFRSLDIPNDEGTIDHAHDPASFLPVVLGQGEALFTDLDLPALGFSVTEHAATEYATHFVLERV